MQKRFRTAPLTHIHTHTCAQTHWRTRTTRNLHDCKASYLPFGFCLAILLPSRIRSSSMAGNLPDVALLPSVYRYQSPTWASTAHSLVWVLLTPWGPGPRFLGHCSPKAVAHLQYMLSNSPLSKWLAGVQTSSTSYWLSLGTVNRDQKGTRSATAGTTQSGMQATKARKDGNTAVLDPRSMLTHAASMHIQNRRHELRSCTRSHEAEKRRLRGQH